MATNVNEQRMADAIATAMTLVTVPVSGGGGGGGGDATAANQTTEIARLEAIRDRLPSAGTSTEATLLLILARLMPAGTSYQSIGANATANVKATAGNLFSLSCTNLNAAIRYLLLFDSTGSTAGTPVRSYPVYANSGVLLLGTDIFGGVGLAFANGITFGFSTTALTYAAGTAADCVLALRYN